MTFPLRNVQLSPDNISGRTILQFSCDALDTISIGVSICRVAFNLKNRKKTKITKNRSIMVVSDHNQPV